MYRLKERPGVKAIEFINGPPFKYLAALTERYEALGVGAAIFSDLDGVSRLLLLQRSESDSLPGKWEFPGGTDSSTHFSYYRSWLTCARWC